MWTQKNLYGTGIKIAIVDGVQGVHEDLQCNYDADLSFDIDLNTTRQEPLELDDHGTACRCCKQGSDSTICKWKLLKRGSMFAHCIQAL